jgi:tetratricopeptide (TPR) repeat protein
MIIYAHDDSEKRYGIDQDWQNQPAAPGISFMIRSRAEERTLDMAIYSLKTVSVPHEIVLVTNGPEIEIPPEWPVRHFTYPHTLARPGAENIVTPIDSVHSLVWFYNWCLSKTRFSYIFKFDADFVASRILIDEFPSVLAKPPAKYKIKAAYADTLIANTEVYLFPKEPGPYYERYLFWELMKTRRTCPASTLNGSILHDSTLNVTKQHLVTPAWWDGTEHGKELERKCQEIVDKIGIRFARASDPESASAEWKLLVYLAEQKVATHPSAENYLNLSVACYEAGQYRECISAAERAIELKPDFAVAFNNISAAHRVLSEWDEAITAASEAVRIDPNYQLGKNNLAAAKQGKKTQQENISRLVKTAADQPTADNYINLSVAYYEAAQFEDCIAAARKALDLRPDIVQGYVNICACNNRLGHFEEARKAGEEAVRLEPDNHLAKNNLRWAIRELEKK